MTEKCQETRELRIEDKTRYKDCEKVLKNTEQSKSKLIIIIKCNNFKIEKTL